MVKYIQRRKYGAYKGKGNLAGCAHGSKISF